MRFDQISVHGAAVVTVVMACLLPAAGQNAARSAHAAGSETPPNLSGYWELHFDSRNVPPASLETEIAAEDPTIQYK
jgi:hypothetical protein